MSCTESDETLTQLDYGNVGLSSAIFSPDGRRLAVASNDSLASIWDLNSGKEIAKFKHDDDYVTSVAFSPDGEKVATGDGSNSAHLWDLESGEEIIRFTHGNSVTAVAFSPDGQTIATASSDSTARTWDISSGEEIIRFTHGNSVTAVAFSPDGQTIATASSDGTARLWDIKSEKEFAQFNHQDTVTEIIFSPDGHTIATASKDSTVRLWTRSHKELSDKICSHISRNLTAFEWTTYLDRDLEAYELTCEQRDVHPSVLAQAKALAGAGDIGRAIAIYRRAKRLQPDIDLDPSTLELDESPELTAQKQVSSNQ